MSGEEEDFYSYAAYHEISDFADLSIAELIALEFLARYTNPIVRHTLYTEVNQFIEYKEDIPPLKDMEVSKDFQKKFDYYIKSNNNPISTSTFYSSLSNFERMGLLQFKMNKSGKVESIKPTPYTKFVPKLLLKFLLNNDIMDSVEYRLEFSDRFLEVLAKYGKEAQFDSVLTLWFSEYVAYSLLQQLAPFSKEFFVISKNDESNITKPLELTNLNVSNIHNRKIREPENFFDGVLVPVYKQNPKFYNLTREEILHEVLRVTKPGGLIGIVGMADVPLTNNPFADELIKLYKLSVKNRIFTKEELQTDLEEVGLTAINVYEHQGLLIGVGQKGER